MLGKSRDRPGVILQPLSGECPVDVRVGRDGAKAGGRIEIRDRAEIVFLSMPSQPTVEVGPVEVWGQSKQTSYAASALAS